MVRERRQFPRVNGPFDGHWDGLSGLRDCRITDVSAGGCFVDSVGSPDVGSHFTIAVTLDGQTYDVPAEVAYVDRIQGFGASFLPGDATAALAAAVHTRLSLRG
jgi:hypothetical protein